MCAAGQEGSAGHCPSVPDRRRLLRHVRHVVFPAGLRGDNSVPELSADSAAVLGHGAAGTIGLSRAGCGKGEKVVQIRGQIRFLVVSVLRGSAACAAAIAS